MPRRRAVEPCQNETILKSAFTIAGAKRYQAAVILILAAAAAAGSTPQMAPRSPAAAKVEARATVRILSGAHVHLGNGKGRDGFVRRNSIIRTAGGTQRAELIEFE